MHEQDKIFVIMVLSSGRSGSTILDMLMDSHSKIFGAGELFQYHKCLRNDVPCSCGKNVSECEFWNKVFKDVKYSNLRIGRNKINFLFNRQKFIIGDKDVNIKEYIKLNEKIYGNIAKFSGKPIIFDSSKEPDRAELLTSSKKLKIVLLHLVRDGRGVAWSFHKGYGGYLRHMYRWFKANIKIEIIKRRHLNIKKIYVNYGKFVEYPEKTLKYILDTLNCDFEADMINFRNYKHHQIGGNLKTKFSSRWKIIADNEWQWKMPVLYKIIFFVLFGWLNKKYLNNYYANKK